MALESTPEEVVVLGRVEGLPDSEDLVEVDLSKQVSK
tara:strand:+ start:370 stop:480 length:111 start_codon:yes stop_codon:yes gene_type:complete